MKNYSPERSEKSDAGLSVAFAVHDMFTGVHSSKNEHLEYLPDVNNLQLIMHTQLKIIFLALIKS